MRIEGILLPSDWDDDGRVTALVLATSDESELPIQTEKAPGQFEPFYRKRVVVDGDLSATGLFRLKAIGFYEVDLESVGTY
jgi:hypothetical protein